MALSYEEIAELEEDILRSIPETITEALTKANRSRELQKLLELLCLGHLLVSSSKVETYPNGRIVVLGDSSIKENVILAIGKKLGIDKKRFELVLDYNTAQKYDFRKFEYAPNYAVILFGPIPHSSSGKGSYGNAIAALEEKHKSSTVPAVIKRLASGSELKITKSNFEAALDELLSEGYIETSLV